MDYRPRDVCDADTWAIIAPTVRRAISTQRLERRSSVHHWMSQLTRYFAWCQRQGHPLQVTPVLIDAFCDALTLAPTSIQSHRNRLNRVGAALGHMSSRVTVASRPHTKTGQPPYSPAELERWWQIASSQKTAHRCRLLQATIAFGVGAGLTTFEIGNLLVRDVVPHPDFPDLVLVHLPDRVAPVDTAWLERVRLVLNSAPNEYLLGSPHVQGADVLTQVKSKATIPDDVPNLTVRRLRTTYGVNLLNRRLSPAEFLAVFGGTSAISFERLARFVDSRWDDAQYLRIAAGLA